MPSVADLVESGILRDRVGEYLARAGDVLREAGHVRLVTFTPQQVSGEVDDGETRHVQLSASGDRLEASCECGNATETGLCPHVVAVAIETWHRAPNRGETA